MRWVLCALAMFDARLYIRVCRLDEPSEREVIFRRSRSQLHMAHELAIALEQALWIRKSEAVEEPYIYVRSEYIDVGERHISQASSRTAIMQKLTDVIAACSHHLKPFVCD